jgi:hydroxymethylglutaryl-CoA lyase
MIKKINHTQLEKVILEEQGLRDGFQSLSEIVPTEKKIEYINRLIDAGLKRIQVTSFVHPKLVPQMADAEEIIKAILQKSNTPKSDIINPKSKEEVIFSALVLNKKGVERAAQAGMKHLSISISASNTHSLKNARMTLEEAKTEFREMVALAKSEDISVRGGIQCAFGCRYEGKITEGVVLDLVKHHLDTGIDEIALADSTGMANPMKMRQIMEKVKEISGKKPIALHLHNTENKGLANVYAALEAGIRQFDTAFGGLGGCPFIKSATGNIPTEDTAHMLHQMGFETGIDIPKVAAISVDFQTFLGKPLQGLMYSLYQNQDIEIV